MFSSSSELTFYLKWLLGTSLFQAMRWGKKSMRSGRGKKLREKWGDNGAAEPVSISLPTLFRPLSAPLG